MATIERVITLLIDLQFVSDDKKEEELIQLVSQTKSFDAKYIFNRLQDEGDFLDMCDMEEKYIDIFGVFINSLAGLSQNMRYTGIPNTKYSDPLPKSRKLVIHKIFQILRNKFPNVIPNPNAFISACEYGLFDVVQSLLMINRDHYFEDDTEHDLNKPEFAGLSRTEQLTLGTQNALYRAINSLDRETCMVLI
jgi:hypothetical protein